MAEQPVVAPTSEIVETEAPLPVRPAVISRILSTQFNLERPQHNPLSVPVSVDKDIQALGLAALAPENTLRTPTPLKLPFEDTRIYLVDSYDAGLGGSIERFFDKATVPFGWTTKGGTRIQCAWLMIIAGCSWGDKELFYRKARRRELVTDQGQSNLPGDELAVPVESDSARPDPSPAILP